MLQDRPIGACLKWGPPAGSHGVELEGGLRSCPRSCRATAADAPPVDPEVALDWNVVEFEFNV